MNSIFIISYNYFIFLLYCHSVEQTFFSSSYLKTWSINPRKQTWYELSNNAKKTLKDKQVFKPIVDVKLETYVKASSTSGQNLSNICRTLIVNYTQFINI